MKRVIGQRILCLKKMVYPQNVFLYVGQFLHESGYIIIFHSSELRPFGDDVPY